MLANFLNRSRISLPSVITSSDFTDFVVACTLDADPLVLTDSLTGVASEPNDSAKVE